MPTDLQNTFIELPINQIHIWQCSLLGKKLQPELCSFVSSAEKKKAEQFYNKEDTENYMYSRGILRLLLGRYTGMAPQEITIANDENKKPYMANHSIQFNLSHSYNWLLIAVAHDVLGIDIEKKNSHRKIQSIAKRFFSGPEQEEFNQASEDQKIEIFYKIF